MHDFCALECLPTTPMSMSSCENVDPQNATEVSHDLRTPDHDRALRSLGPGLRRRSDNTVTLQEYASDEDFDMSSGSHSAMRGYFDPEEDGEEQDLTGFGGINLCVVCKIDMGDCNPRQYCCKTYCPHEGVETSEEEEDARCDTVVRTRLVTRSNAVVLELLLDLSTVANSIRKELKI